MPSIPDALGLFLNESSPFSNALSATSAGSTHYTVDTTRDHTLTLWATRNWLFMWSAAGGANDPPALPVNQSNLFYPGAVIPAGALLEVQYRKAMTVSIMGAAPILVTGFRAVTLGGAGTFYCNEFRRGQ